MQTCARCVMNDSADEFISFDENGNCSYCTDALAKKDTWYYPNEVGEQKLESLVNHLKKGGEGKEFDCLMGLSGGLDSSYLAYLGAAKWGLRIAAVHIDDGYDTDISSSNIQKLIEKTGIELVTLKPDAEQFNALTLAYMRAGVPNLAVPQDNVLFAFIYDYAEKHNLTQFLSGQNFATECILQKGNTWDNADLTNIKDIHRRFGTKPIDKLLFFSKLEQKMNAVSKRIETFMPLDFLDYNRDKAFAELKDYCGFEYYGRKHLENHFTAFLQLCWLPEKFGVDKRSSHLSSMVISGQMTREEALKELEEPLYDSAYMAHVKELIASNMGIAVDEIDEMIKAPSHQHDEYKVDKLYPFLIKMKHLIKG